MILLTSPYELYMPLYIWDINIDGYRGLTGTTDCRYDPEI